MTSTSATRSGGGQWRKSALYTRDGRLYRFDRDGLARVRTAHGHSLRVAGDACGVSPAAIHALEQGQSQPAVDLVAKLCRLYDEFHFMRELQEVDRGNT
jgi:DNA-binding XRE family transcriptional regulator